MKLHYWGTAAYESIPALYCTCPTCQRARTLQGRNIRARSQAVIDDVLLIDPNADTNLNSIRYGFEMPRIRAMLVSHGHSDHIYYEDLGIVCEGYSHGVTPLTIYSAAPNLERLRKAIDAAPEKYENRLSVVAVEAFCPFSPLAGYVVTPLAAQHGANPLIFAIEKDGKRLLYAHDTGLFPEATYDYLKKTGMRFDFVSIDCTFANRQTPSKPTSSHQGLLGNIETRARLLEIGAADKDTAFCCNHFSHNGADACYDDFAPIAAEKGFLTSYDGMIVEI